jgi:hypothetical protein
VSNILERPSSTILERVSELSAYVFVDRPGNTNTAGVSQWLEANRYVHPVTMNIVVIGQDVSKIDADTQFDTLPPRQSRIPRTHRLLQRDGTSYRLHCARKLHEHSVTPDPDNVPSVRLDLRPNYAPQYVL